MQKNTALAAWRHLPFSWPACLLSFFLFQTYSVMATISFFLSRGDGAPGEVDGVISSIVTCEVHTLSCHQRMGTARLTFSLFTKKHFRFSFSPSCMDLGLHRPVRGPQYIARYLPFYGILFI
ncbi:uncharacterized protein B0H64DRAFT_232138 [Chaetomium fimeti]|uniref:Uncharacterized protein n=1 Tax=Chaetomium fimeti TaxID=1854472 RepID=A0AAE0LPH0_9PEZI|nr:hypothetical protein B0H64DRAFT_232138 [Chaetomium fimeti]